MKKLVEKKVIIVTGASSGIGKAVAKYFSLKGCIVYGLSRRTFEEKGIVSLCCDVTNKVQVEETLKKIWQKEKRIDLLVNNAGFGISGSVENESLENIEKMFKVNFFGVVNMTQLALPYLRQQGFGKIINTSSVAGIIPIPFQSFYSATKASVDIFAKALRMEVKPFNISVCNVLVGDTKTDFTAKREKSEKDEKSVYEDVVKKSISKMEKDEQNGKEPITVAKVMFKMFNKKHMPATRTVGGMYKIILFLEKILPQKLMLFIVGKMYS
ncbi:MAG: SDR family oxidoreductase [Clostridia bacterium]|nr:SDR family oxidoreductase [Clostridia bacterium]